VDTTSLSQGTVRFPAGDRVAAQTSRSAWIPGADDYPFDRYTTTVGFLVSVADKPCGGHGVRNFDPLFLVSSTGAAEHPVGRGGSPVQPIAWTFILPGF